MRKVIVGLGAGAVASVMSGASTAQWIRQPRYYYAAPGQTIRLNFYTNLGLDCVPLGQAVIRVAKQPTLGRIALARSRSSPVVPPFSPLGHCLGRSVSGTLVSYRAGSTPGLDSVEYLVNFATGQSWYQRMNILVR